MTNENRIFLIKTDFLNEIVFFCEIVKHFFEIFFYGD